MKTGPFSSVSCTKRTCFPWNEDGTPRAPNMCFTCSIVFHGKLPENIFTVWPSKNTAILGTQRATTSHVSHPSLGHLPSFPVSLFFMHDLLDPRLTLFQDLQSLLFFLISSGGKWILQALVLGAGMLSGAPMFLTTKHDLVVTTWQLMVIGTILSNYAVLMVLYVQQISKLHGMNSVKPVKLLSGCRGVGLEPWCFSYASWDGFPKNPCNRAKSSGFIIGTIDLDNKGS